MKISVSLLLVALAWALLCTDVHSSVSVCLCVYLSHPLPLQHTHVTVSTVAVCHTARIGAFQRCDVVVEGMLGVYPQRCVRCVRLWYDAPDHTVCLTSTMRPPTDTHTHTCVHGTV